MAELGSVVTVYDRAKAKDPNGRYGHIANMLAQTNPIFHDFHMVEANKGDAHQYSQVVSEPSPAFRKYNEGAAVGKTTYAQLVDRSGILEQWNRLDELQLRNEKDPVTFRLLQSQGSIGAMGKTGAQHIFYGDPLGSVSSNPVTADADGFRGLLPRFNSKADRQVISAGGSGSDNTSIWLIGHGPNKVYGFYPEGSGDAEVAGIYHKAWDPRPFTTTTGLTSATLTVVEDEFRWQFGLAVHDPRYVVRIGDIDVSDLQGKSSAAALVDLLIKAYHTIENLEMCRPVFYSNRTVATYLDIQAKDVGFGTNDTATIGTNYGAGGANVLNTAAPHSFRGIPWRKCDALSNAEPAMAA